MSIKKSWLPLLSAVIILSLVIILVMGIGFFYQTSANAASGGIPDVDASQLKQLSASMPGLHTPAQRDNLKAQAQGLASASVDANAKVKEPPMFNGSFTFNGQTFPFTMVGSDPTRGSKTSRIKTIVIPVSTHFPDQNVTLFNDNATAQLIKSPIFSTSHSVVGDKTQFADSFQRNQFHKFVSTVSPNYHVLLNQPVVHNILRLELPHNTSNEVADLVIHVPGTNIKIGIVDINFFFPWIENQVLAMHLPTDTLPIFQFSNVLLNSGSIDPKHLQCCTLGFHDAFTPASRPNEVHTFIYESFTSPGALNGVSDVSVISHEVAEWINDPFDINPTPGWINAFGQCQNNLETGDFLEQMPGSTFKVDGFTFQDETNLWWFARTARPTPATAHNYDFLGTLTTLPTLCS